VVRKGLARALAYQVTDEVRDGLRQYLEATGYQRVLLLMALPGIETALALRSMRLFANEVAPTLTPVAQGSAR
jgi:hypothetical protein